MKIINFFRQFGLNDNGSMKRMFVVIKSSIRDLTDIHLSAFIYYFFTIVIIFKRSSEDYRQMP